MSTSLNGEEKTQYNALFVSLFNIRTWSIAKRRKLTGIYLEVSYF
jgi:hypothetical protein